MKDWIDSIEARTKKQAKYDKTHTTSLHMKLNIKTDADIIQWLWGQRSKQGAIKELIRKDISESDMPIARINDIVTARIGRLEKEWATAHERLEEISDGDVSSHDRSTPKIDDCALAERSRIEDIEKELGILRAWAMEYQARY